MNRERFDCLKIHVTLRIPQNTETIQIFKPNTSRDIYRKRYDKIFLDIASKIPL